MFIEHYVISYQHFIREQWDIYFAESYLLGGNCYKFYNNIFKL